MNARFILVLAILSMAGCKAGLPNAVFSCSSDAECPAGFFCHLSQGFCFDTPEPECEPFRECGAVFQCGQFDDGCGSTVTCAECMDGDVCGEGGSPFSCGCEPATCAEAGATCGTIPSGCGENQLTDCSGGMPNDGCPEGWSCNASKQCECVTDCVCTPPCEGGQICVGGECVCEADTCAGLEYTCGEHDDGCGGTLDCGTCVGGETCGTWSNQPFTCGGCSCEDQGFECGQHDLCGETVPCGICENEAEPLCSESFRCVCVDEYDEVKRNDDGQSATTLPTQQSSFALLETRLTLDTDDDDDWYAIPFEAKPDNRVSAVLTSTNEKVFEGLRVSVFLDCPGSSFRCVAGNEVDDDGFDGCRSQNTPVAALTHDCDSSEARILVNVDTRDWAGPCDVYTMRVSAGNGSIEPPL